jgi:amino acid transporter, AAT family
MLFSLARSGWAPARLGRLSSAGVPRAAALASSYGIMAALVLEKWAPRSAFVSIFGAVLVGMLLSWLVSLAAHVSFRSQPSPDQLTALPIRSPFGVWGSAVGFILVIAAIFEQGSRLALGSGAVFIVLLTGAYFVLKESRRKRTISL